MTSYNFEKEDEILNLLYSFLPKENFSGNFHSLKKHFSKFDRLFAKAMVPIITVGGTNGKGETCLLLKSILEGRNKKTAVFTSPHILSLTERFYFLGNNISYEELKKLILKCSLELKDINLSFYEFLFYAFCTYCVELLEELDYIILEVGLGGKKDTVNLLTPFLTAITSISRDHQEILGKSYRSILVEKLGITRKGVPLITNFKTQYIKDLTQNYCNANHIEHVDIEELLGDDSKKSYSQRNRLHSYCLSHYLEFRDFNFCTLSANLDFPFMSKGRFEMMTMGKIRFIFIGAHNIDGIRMLKDTLSHELQKSEVQLPLDELWISFSKRDIRDIRGSIKVFKSLKGAYKNLWMTSFEHDKAFNLEKELKSRISTALPNIMEWKSRIKIMDKDVTKSVAIAGSYYFIGEIQKEILRLS